MLSNSKGYTLAQLMVSAGIMFGLALTLGGVWGLVRLFVPGNLPSPQLGLMADRTSNQICRDGLSSCFVSIDDCQKFLKPVIMKCFDSMRAGTPPIMSPQEENYFLQITRPCWSEGISKKLAAQKPGCK